MTYIAICFNMYRLPLFFLHAFSSAHPLQSHSTNSPSLKHSFIYSFRYAFACCLPHAFTAYFIYLCIYLLFRSQPLLHPRAFHITRPLLFPELFPASHSSSFLNNCLLIHTCNCACVCIHTYRFRNHMVLRSVPQHSNYGTCFLL